MEWLLSWALRRHCILSIHLHLLPLIQLLQVLPLIRLDRQPIELGELRASQLDDLVAVLGRLLNYWVT